MHTVRLIAGSIVFLWTGGPANSSEGLLLNGPAGILAGAPRMQAPSMPLQGSRKGVAQSRQ